MDNPITKSVALGGVQYFVGGNKDLKSVAANVAVSYATDQFVTPTVLRMVPIPASLVNVLGQYSASVIDALIYSVVMKLVSSYSNMVRSSGFLKDFLYAIGTDVALTMARGALQGTLPSPGGSGPMPPAY